MWFFEIEYKRAKSYSLYLLARKSYHSKDLKEKLLQKNLSKKAVEKTILFLQKIKYLDDMDFIKRAIEKEHRKGYGQKYIFLKLSKKGLFLSSFESTYSSLISDDMEQEMIKKLLKKKKSLDFKKKANFFLRRGFEYQKIKELIEKET